VASVERKIGHRIAQLLSEESFRAQLVFFERYRTVFMRAPFLGEVVQQLADTCVPRLCGRLFLKAPALHLHGSYLFARTVSSPNGRISQTGLRLTKALTPCRRMSGKCSPNLC
jgi:hypothetical protein